MLVFFVVIVVRFGGVFCGCSDVSMMLFLD